jgi:predicted aspartyl protease
LCFALLPAGLAPAAAAQEEAEQRSDVQGAAAAAHELTLEELLSKIFLAYGGRDALMQMNGPLAAYGRHVTITGDGEKSAFAYRMSRKSGKFRIDLSALPGAGQDGQQAASSAVTAYDGVAVWRSIDGQVHELPEAQARAVLEQEERLPSLLCRFRQPGYTFSLAGRTTYRQMPVFAVEVAHEGSPAVTFFIDQRNYLAVGSSCQGTDPESGAACALAADYSEYRPAGGTLVPFKQVRYVDDKPVSETRLDSIAFNVPIEEASFHRPGQAAAVHLARPETVAVEYSHGQLIMKVALNGGEPLDFLVDTGASDTIVDRRAAAEHYLDKQGTTSIAAASAAVAMQVSQIRRLEMGNVVLNDVPALILDLTPQSRQLGRRVSGIIGHTVLSRFVVTIDYGRPAVTFADPAAYRVQEGAAVAPFLDRRGPLIKAVLNGVEEQTFLIDTGAAFNHLPAEAARRYVKGQAQHFTEGTGLDGRPVRLGTVTVDGVDVAGQKVKSVSFTYAAQEAHRTAPHQPPREQGGFFQTTNLGILGNPFWTNFITTLDYKFKRLILKPNQALRSRQEIERLITTGDGRLVMHRDYRAADQAYRRALAAAQVAGDQKHESLLLGRLGNLHRVMARDLNRPELARSSYDYFTKAQAAARKTGDRESEGRILADWSLLYSDRGQAEEARTMIGSALLLAPQDPQVNVDYAVHLYRGKLYGEMQKYIDKALFLDPSNWQALWYQVKLSEMFFDTPRLTTTLKEILRFYPWSKLAAEKLSQLQARPAPPPARTPTPPAKQAPLRR